MGRRLANKAGDAKQDLYAMRVFAKNEVVAKSKFWYFLKLNRRLKRANGEIVSVSEVSASPEAAHLFKEEPSAFLRRAAAREGQEGL